MLPGPKAYLIQAKEEVWNILAAVLKSWLWKDQERCFVIESVANDKGLLQKSKVSDGWFRHFLECQPHFSLRKRDSIAHIRMDTINAETLHQYCDPLQEKGPSAAKIRNCIITTCALRVLLRVERYQDCLDPSFCC